MQKMKKILLGNYPHRRITALLLCLSVVILCMVFKNEGTVTEGPDVITGSTGQPESMVEREEDLTETERSESLSVDKEVEESMTAEEPVMEETENEKEPEPSITPEDAPGGEPQESVTPAATLEPEISQTPEAALIPEATPAPKPTPIPEATPAPEPTSIPEVTPTPEEIPTSESEENTPEPEVTPSPHEHSWIFESWYQEPTCSNGGLVMEICAHCGETQITGGTPTGEHSYEVETPGDCLSEEVVVCTVCNYREVREKNLSNHIDVEDGFCYGCGKKTE